MILISHRGNLNGRINHMENNPEYIDGAINSGFDVEIDIWYIENNLYLGHDSPQYLVDIKWLEERSKNLWIHCKDFESMSFFNKLKSPFNYFWHENDSMTLTSLGKIWAFPGKQPIKGSIAVLPEIFNDNLDNCIGICSDIVMLYKIKFNK